MKLTKDEAVAIRNLRRAFMELPDTLMIDSDEGYWVLDLRITRSSGLGFIRIYRDGDAYSESTMDLML